MVSDQAETVLLAKLDEATAALATTSAHSCKHADLPTCRHANMRVVTLAGMSMVLRRRLLTAVGDRCQIEGGSKRQ